MGKLTLCEFWQQSLSLLLLYPLLLPLATTTEHQSILENVQTRSQFVDDLLELQEFLSQRLREMSSESSGMLFLDQVGDDVMMM